MKKIILMAMSAAFIISCGNNTNSTVDKKADTTTTTTATAPASDVPTPADPEAKKGLALAAKSDCFTCHKLNETSVGPSYADVAARYHNDPGSYDSLANKIIKGGTGNWGALNMSAHKDLSKEDAITMLHYVMSIKK